jgi:hypothetical protein
MQQTALVNMLEAQGRLPHVIACPGGRQETMLFHPTAQVDAVDILHGQDMCAADILPRSRHDLPWCWAKTNVQYR